MGKFKVGDKVRILDVKGIAGARNEGYTDNEVVKLVNPNILNFVGFPGKITAEPLLISLDEYKYLELVDSKPTKKQRIESLEKRVEELEKLVSDYFKLPVEPSTGDVEDKPKTPNQLRAEIIEKAKGFVVGTKKSHTGRAIKGPLKGQIVTWNDVYVCNNDLFISCVCNVEFVINNDKRTIVALLRGADTNEIYYRGIAKCNPSDVFNEHIGKAIALGRALGLDVSEFEGAVQPTVAVGQIVKSKINVEYEVFSLDDVIGNVKYHENSKLRDAVGGYLPHETWYKIINDTNAVYKSEVE